MTSPDIRTIITVTLKPNLFEKLAARFNTPFKVQQLIRSLDYNGEENGETVRSAAEAFNADKAHCLEASMLSAAILEHHDYPPFILNLDSIDWLNHSIFVFKEKTGWGAISKSREEGLHGRAPIFRSIRELAWSYHDPYIDDTGRVIGYEVVDLRNCKMDWRWSKKNLWKVEELVTTLKFKPLKSSDERYEKLVKSYEEKGPLPPDKNWW